MTAFDDRKDAFESKFAHDEKLSFDLEAKCSKLFGLWAAEQLGLEAGEAESYAKEVVMANLEEAGFDDIIRKVRADFDQKGVEISDHVININLEKSLLAAQKAMSEG
ncbi:MAG: hypothetical protein CMH27_11595 [Micavibrio sp.]|nr:hypothetical protein [Micavibrio sp.]|tara:strand:+ start:961 stop:1281 length:321 start_codon:yes stop_codon:yes gene_type:complete